MPSNLIKFFLLPIKCENYFLNFKFKRLKAKENEIKRKNYEIKQINESIESEKQKMTKLENDLADRKLENTK